MKEIAVELLLLIVAGSGAELLPTKIAVLKVSVPWVKLTAPEAMPVPLSETVRLGVLRLPPMLSAPLRVPACVGEKLTLIVQLPPGATELLWQPPAMLPFIVKSPLVALKVGAR